MRCGRRLGLAATLGNLSIAIDESYIDRNGSGERIDKTEWHKVVTFQDRLIDMLQRNAKKGRLVHAEGIVEEAGEAVPALQHVVHCHGHGGVAREPAALGAHPVFELRDDRRAPFPAHGKTPLGTLAVDLALDIEQRVDPRDRLQRQRRHRRCALAPSLAGSRLVSLRHDLPLLCLALPPTPATSRPAGRCARLLIGN